MVKIGYDDRPATNNFLYRTRNQSIIRIYELMQGVLILRCFHAWSAFWLEEKRGLQAMQLFHELETKHAALEKAEQEHEIEVKDAEESATYRYRELIFRWKSYLCNKMQTDTQEWMHRLFHIWKRKTMNEEFSPYTTILWRWSRVVQAVYHNYFMDLSTAISGRLRTCALKMTRGGVGQLPLLKVCFRSWELLRRRLYRRTAVQAVATRLFGKTSTVILHRLFTTWKKEMLENKLIREEEREKRDRIVARTDRVNFLHQHFNEKDFTLLRHILLVWIRYHKNMKNAQMIEKLTEECEEAKRQVTGSSTEAQSLRLKLGTVEQESTTAQKKYDSTLGFRDQEYKLLQTQFEASQEALKELQGTAEELEELKQSVANERLQNEIHLSELSGDLDEAKLEKIRLEERIMEMETEMEREESEETNSKQMVKDLNKQIERQNRKFQILKQEQKNLLTEKETEIEKLKQEREKENVVAQQKLQKITSENKLARKKLTTINNNAQETAAKSKLETLESVKVNLERKLTVAEKDCKRYQLMHSVKVKENAALTVEKDELQLALDKLNQKFTVFETNTKIKLAKRKAEEAQPKEEEEYKKLQKELSVINQRNDMIELDCHRREIWSKLKEREIKLMNEELCILKMN